MEHARQHENQAAPQLARRAARGKEPAEPQPLTHLLQRAGNQAVQQLLRSGAIRAKLSISQPGDPEELEADATADRIMRSHTGVESPATSCSCGSDEEEMCDECRHQATGISRKAAESSPPQPPHRVVDAITRSAGRPLDAATRAFFEPHFGQLLSQVRIHTDASAASSARSIQAHAFTAGNGIYFASGQYAPDSNSGRRLLAHELTHVAQRHSSTAESLRRQPDAGTDGGTQQLAHKDDALDAGASQSPGTAAADTGPLDFEGLQLTTDSVSIVNEIENYVQAHGLDALQGLKQRFAWELLTLGYNQQDRSGAPDPEDKEAKRLAKMKAIAPAFRLAADLVDQQCKVFLVTFDGEAHKVLTDMLAASRARITSEQSRYGLTRTDTPKTRWTVDEFGVRSSETTSESAYGMADNAGTKGLSNAAKALADKARTVLSLMEARNKLMPMSTSEFGATTEDWAPYDAADKKVQQAAGDYNVLRFTTDRDYPILAAFDELNIDPATHGTYDVNKLITQLSGVANRSTDTPNTLYNDTANRLANIDKVTAAVAKGDLRVWRLDPVVSLTLQHEQSNLPADLQERLVSDKAKESTPEELLDTALGVLAIALGAIAAIPTGGASLAVGIGVAAAAVGSAALGGYFAIEHIQRYALEAAANGTDFDKARAVSQVDPSFFWLAVDIVLALGGMAADIHTAAAAFKTVAQAYKEAAELRQLAQQGQRATDADAALARLKQEAEKVSPGLGDELAARIAKGGAAVDKKAALVAWEDSLNPETRAFLVDNPGVRAVYEDMDQLTRWLCTMCASGCLIENISRAQVARIRAVMQRIETEEFERLRIYLHVNRGSIESAIGNLERVADDEGLRALFNRSLTETANPPTPPLLTAGAAKVARNTPGAASGGEHLEVAGSGWLRDTGGTSGLIPGQIAAKLRGRTFATFDDLQAAFWREVAADPSLAAGFKPTNVTTMAGGDAPFALQSERWGGVAQGRYVLHHIVPIEHGGGVYDLDNLLVTSPRLHWGVIHSPTVPMAKFRQLPVDE